MNKLSQQKPKTTLGGFPYTPSRKKDNSQKGISSPNINSNEPVIEEEELLQFWWRY
ncbi:MAG: hypothetical protein ACKVQB_00465 [Bacteroidia bacterium]